jgi:hypothetical protein
MICEQIRFSGRVEILVIDMASGEVVKSISKSNLIVDMGKNFFARVSADPSFTSSIRQIALGKGTLPATPIDTNLGNPLVSGVDVNNASAAIATVVRSMPTAKMAKFVATFPAGGLTTASDIISEVILIFDSSDRVYTSATPIAFTPNGGVFARLGGFEPFSKSAGQQVVVSWYTQTEYAYTSGQECQSCCDRKVQLLTDAAVIPLDLSGDPDVLELRTLSQSCTFLPPTPSPKDGKILELRIRSFGGYWTLGWPANFAGTLYPLPMRVSGGNDLDRIFMEFNAFTNMWECIGVDTPANIILGRGSSLDTAGVVTSGDNTINLGKNNVHTQAYGNASYGNNITIGSLIGLAPCGYNLVMGYFSPGTCSIGMVGGASFGNTILSPEGGSYTLNNSSFNFFVGLNNIGDDVDNCVGLGSVTLSSCSDVVAIGSEIVNYGDSNIIIGKNGAVGGLGNPSSQNIAIGDGASVIANRTGCQAYGAGASGGGTGNNEVVFGSATVPVTTFYAVSDAPGNPSLFFFSRANISAIHETAMYLLYRNATGTLVTNQVRVDPITGALTVAL